MAARRRSLRVSGIRRRKQNTLPFLEEMEKKLLLSTNPPGPTPYNPQTVISEGATPLALAMARTLSPGEASRSITPPA